MEQPITSHATHPVNTPADDLSPVAGLILLVAAGALGFGIYCLGGAVTGLVLAYAA